jgi:hypothetical protein
LSMSLEVTLIVPPPNSSTGRERLLSSEAGETTHGSVCRNYSSQMMAVSRPSEIAWCQNTW